MIASCFSEGRAFVAEKLEDGNAGDYYIIDKQGNKSKLQVKNAGIVCSSRYAEILFDTSNNDYELYDVNCKIAGVHSFRSGEEYASAQVYDYLR